MNSYRQSESYRDRDRDRYPRDRDREYDRGHYRVRDREMERDRDTVRVPGRDRDRSGTNDRTRDHPSRSRSPERNSPARRSSEQLSKTGVPNDPRVRANDTIYETTTSTPDKAISSDRIMSDVLPNVSNESSLNAETKLATLMKHLTQAAVEEGMYKTRVDDVKDVIERRQAEQKRLSATSFASQFPHAFQFHDRDIAQSMATYRELETRLKSARDRTRNLPKQITDELTRILPPKDTPPVPLDFLARFETLEKSLSEEKNGRAEEMKRAAEEMKVRDERMAALEEANQSLRQTIKALEDKASTLEKSCSSLDARLRQETQERHRIKIQVQAVEKTANASQNDVDSFRQELSDQNAALEDIREKKKAEAPGVEPVVAAERLMALETKLEAVSKEIGSHGKQLSDMDIPGIDEAVAFSANFSAGEIASIKRVVTTGTPLPPDLGPIKKDITGLKQFDEEIVELFGNMIDDLQKQIVQLQGQVGPLVQNQHGNSTVESVRSNVNVIQPKVAMLEEGLQGIISRLSGLADMDDIKTKVDNFLSMVENLQKQMEAHDMQIASLDARWNNIYTKDFADRVIGFVEKMYPHPQQLQAAVKDISVRLGRMEQQVQLAGLAQVQASERKRSSLRSSDQTIT
ncbi:hypothetical protein MKZ38_005607 [Zalerion maritima]|uniref:Uncharacterized protein n=1 Tax=Zalerion maritima TaxID=339359 RepID=A0AAD5RKF7_9PEZI|nr:hypothetical protein MKZ38_005607 [Zalerion maritima]